MATLGYKGERFTALAGETVLDALLRNGVEIPNACRSGVCRSCLMAASDGTVPEAAQAGLREIERRQGMFLACLCRPDGDLELRDVDDQATTAARIVEVAHLSESVVRLRLQPEAPFEYEAGQYLSLRRADGLIRSYSLASLPNEPWLELHLRRMPGGRMSSWAYDEARPGTTVSLRGPYGSCCYLDDPPDAPILMVGVGTGLAPLWGVVRQALASGHRGPITLIQAAAEPNNLYMREELRELAGAHPQLRVRTCVLRGGGGELEERPVDALAVEQLRESGDAAAHLAYVCGDAAIVQRVRRGLFMAGVSARRILVDAFVTAPAA
ncbi:MAG TPA: 2Fe-2S iron-sulfur cluster-binding protein [Enhygromyxa sp.]|nr:2Fe-2S iron-sulfur cluster-binding protein [Enhygromyxa sp.]